MNAYVCVLRRGQGYGAPIIIHTQPILLNDDGRVGVSGDCPLLARLIGFWLYGGRVAFAQTNFSIFHLHAYIHTCVGVWVYGCKGIWAYGRMCVCVYGCMCVWMYVYDSPQFVYVVLHYMLSLRLGLGLGLGLGFSVRVAILTCMQWWRG